MKMAEVLLTKEKEGEKRVHGREASSLPYGGVCEEREGRTGEREGLDVAARGSRRRRRRRRCRTAALSRIADTRAAVCRRGPGSNRQPAGLQTISYKRLWDGKTTDP